MAWVRIDDTWLNHPKVMHARAVGGWTALGVWCGALTWANQQRSDGHVPTSWVVLNNAQADADVLVEAGLWVAVDDGFVFHDYSDYQPTRAEIEAKTEQRAAAGKRGGSKSQANRKQTASNSEANVNPVPVPKPNPSALTEQRRARSSSSEKSLRNKRRLGLVAGEGSAA
jgi:hypothetical protein